MSVRERVLSALFARLQGVFARATTTVLVWARAGSARSQAPRGVCFLVSDGRAARAPWISSLRK